MEDSQLIELNLELVGELITKRELLAKRLEDGYQRIRTAETGHRDVSDWETFWIGLLREYERVCDEIADAQSAQPLAA